MSQFIKEAFTLLCAVALIILAIGYGVNRHAEVMISGGYVWVPEVPARPSHWQLRDAERGGK